MKKLLPLFLLFSVLGTASFSQVIGEKWVNQKVKDQFAADFPGVTPTRWEKKGTDAVAHMQHDGKKATARYTKEGRQRWVTHAWKGKDLSATITDPILKEYPGFTPNWATESDNPNTKKHQFWVHLSKPGAVLKVLMNADGPFAKEDNADIEDEVEEK